MMTVARSAASVSVASALVAATGFLREVVTARWFGAGYEVDVFLVVFTVMTLGPNLISQTLLGVFIPVFARNRERSARAAWEFAGATLNYSVLVLTTIAILCYEFRGPILRIAAPGFGLREHSIAMPLFAICIPIAVLWVANELIKSILNCLGQFFWPSLSQILPGIGVVCAVVIWAHGKGVNALTLGWLCGMGAQTVLLVILLVRAEYSYVAAWRPTQPGLAEMVRVAMPYFAVHFAINFLYFIDRQFASELGTGVIAQLYFADRFLRMPILLFTVPLFTAFHPHLSERMMSAGIDGLKKAAYSATQATAVITVPFSVCLAILSRPIIAFAYSGGAFTASDAATTAMLMQYLMPLVFATSIFFIVDRVFNTLGDSVTLMWAAFLMVATKWIGTALLVKWIGIVGLPVGTVIMFVVGISYLCYMLRRKIGSLSLRSLALSCSRTTVASVLAGTIAWSAHTLFHPVWSSRRPVLAIEMAAVAGLTAVMYFAFLRIFDGPESQLVRRMAHFRRAIPIVEPV
jgi:putative peptidoglycan lipid II flippase